MRTRNQLWGLVILLLGIGTGVILYKHFVLGFPLLTTETQAVWQVEARLSFDAKGGPLEARLNMPDQADPLRLVFMDSLAPRYRFETTEEEGHPVAVWARDDAPPGPASVSLYSEWYFAEDPVHQAAQPPSPPLAASGDVQDATLAAVNAYLDERHLEGAELVSHILREVNNPTSDVWTLLHRERDDPRERLQLAMDVLAHKGIATVPVRGIVLRDSQRSRSARYFLMAYLEQQWQVYDPGAAEPVPPERFLPFQKNDEALFEVTGAEESQLEFATIMVPRAKYLNAVENARNHRSWLIDFSIYSLPLEQQSAFKLLLLIPLGALVVVILRNLVGIRTSGTFMPILIALVFLQTSLLTGLILFLIVVGMGLVLRSYLSHLHLLLVPRIASVLVFVIIIYAAIGIASHKLGLPWGMKVTFFPMIILSWTIERMSILWDEEGGHEVMIQGSGSLLTATLAYLVMHNQGVADSIFLYPEALLIILAVIISIGTYSGYRLSDLRRFEPMERH